MQEGTSLRVWAEPFVETNTSELRTVVETNTSELSCCWGARVHRVRKMPCPQPTRREACLVASGVEAHRYDRYRTDLLKTRTKNERSGDLTLTNVSQRVNDAREALFKTSKLVSRKRGRGAEGAWCCVYVYFVIYKHSIMTEGS